MGSRGDPWTASPFGVCFWPSCFRAELWALSLQVYLQMGVGISKQTERRRGNEAGISVLCLLHLHSSCFPALT